MQVAGYGLQVAGYRLQVAGGRAGGAGAHPPERPPAAGRVLPVLQVPPVPQVLPVVRRVGAAL